MIKKKHTYWFLGTLAGFSAIDILSNPQLIKHTRGYARWFFKIKKNDDFSRIFPLLIISETISNFNSFEKLLEKRNKSYEEYDFDILEFHIDSNDNDLINKIGFMCAKNELPNKSISINLSRKFFSNANIVELIKMLQLFQNNLFIEVDGLTKG